MEFRVISKKSTSFEEQTARFLANFRANQQQGQQASPNITTGTHTIAERLFQAFPVERKVPGVPPPGSGRKHGHGSAAPAAPDHGLHIPQRANPTTMFSCIGPDTYQVSNDIMLHTISDRGRNTNDFCHFGAHYAYVLVVSRVSGQHSWTLAKDSAPAWIQIAKGEVGVAEIKGSTNDSRVIDYQHSVNSRINGEDGKDFAWCATFINWVLIKAGLPASNVGTDGKKVKGQNGRGAWEFEHYGTKLSKPVFGCIATFNHKGQRHVGFIVGRVTHGKSVQYAILGGNQSNQVSVSTNSSPTQLRWPTNGGATGNPEDLREYDNRYGFLVGKGSTR